MHGVFASGMYYSPHFFAGVGKQRGFIQNDPVLAYFSLDYPYKSKQ